MMSIELVVVFKANPMDSEVIKEILNDNEIKANVKNQLMGIIVPWRVSGLSV